MKPPIELMNAYHARMRADEHVAALLATLDIDKMIALESAYLDYERASWNLYETLRRKGCKPHRARQLSTGREDE